MAAVILNLVLAVLLPAVPPTSDKDREPNPLVPSLHQLTDEEEAEFDRIVDRFIQADIGDASLPIGHHSREYRQAYQGLRKMGPDGFFAVLIRGFNREAKMEYKLPDSRCCRPCRAGKSSPRTIRSLCNSPVRISALARPMPHSGHS